jgi:hypothetical protein
LLLVSGVNVLISNCTSAIDSHQVVINNILLEIFRLDISYSITSNTSFADTCKISEYGSVALSNLAAGCSHSTQHLTNTALKTYFVSDVGAGTSTVSKYLWTGHILPDNPRSNSWALEKVLMMYPDSIIDSYTSTTVTLKSSNVINIESRFELLHETSHQLGTPDHYCYGSILESTCSNPECYYHTYGLDSLPTCVMSYRMNVETQSLATMYCDSCKNKIQAELDDHHFGG